MKNLIVVIGPTAVGKTAAAIVIAERLKTEVVSADSRQVFKELNIGTAKPSPDELKRITHHFIGSQSIHASYDAGQYGREAMAQLEVLFKKYDSVVMVGGSGLYLKAVLEGFDEMPNIPPGLREEIIAGYQANGLPWLQQEVAAADPVYFAEVDQQNPQRLMRALELMRTSGKPMQVLRSNKKKDLPFGVVKIGLNVPREELYRRIDTRMDNMIAKGLFDEARQFHALQHLNALQTVGYSEIFGYLNGLHDYDEAVRLLKRNSRRYAKRQLTWFLSDPEISWFNNEEEIMRWLASQSFGG